VNENLVSSQHLLCRSVMNHRVLELESAAMFKEGGGCPTE
jgi:hypothetical protein